LPQQSERRDRADADRGGLGRDAGVTEAPIQRASRELLLRLQEDPEVAAVRFERSAQHVDPSLRYLNVEVVGRNDYGKPRASTS
jgi:hypothetical protein